MVIDIRTLVLMLFIVNVINNIVIWMVWRLYRAHFRGLSLLLGDMFFQTIGSLFLLLRGMIPAFVSIIVSNILTISGTMLVLNGLERFFGQPKRRIYNYVLISIFAALMCYFTVYNDSLMMRDICISGMIVLINAQSCWLLLHGLNPSYRKIARVTAYTLLIYCAFSLARIIALLLIPPQSNEFFRSGIVDSISMIMYISLSILITAGFTLMVSRRLLDEVQTEKGKYISAFHSSPYAILLTKVADGTIFEVNDGFVKISGYQPEEVIGKTTLGIGLWADAEDRRAFISDIQNGNEVRDREVKFRIKNGEIITGLLSSQRILAYGEECILTSVSDITELIRIKDRLVDLAMHDPLTGLPNRNLFYDRAAIALANAARDKCKMAVISLDVDFLKTVNDRWGHAAGDQVLITISRRLSDLLRKGDTISRFGGDEFVILLSGGTGKEGIVATVKKIVESLSAGTVIGQASVNISVSMGVALYPDDGGDIDALIGKSDEALYLVKTNGRNGYRFYCDMHEQS